MKHHTEDYKETAIKYYLDHNKDIRDTCKIIIFCSLPSRN